MTMTKTLTDYEFWIAVLGERGAAETVAEFGLTAGGTGGLAEWVDRAVHEAHLQGADFGEYDVGRGARAIVRELTEAIEDVLGAGPARD